MDNHGKMNRRELIVLCGAAMGGSVWTHIAGAENTIAFEEGALFEAGRSEVLALAERVMEKCVLAKIWDTMFVVDLLALLPDTEKLIREVFQNYWDFQDRWNRQAPDYARDMITVAIKTEPQPVRQFSQIPILAWGLERVFRRNGDRQLLEQCLGRLERFHEWFWRERDLHDNGLLTVGAYSGKLQHAKWETFDYECNMDGLQLTAHPRRKGPDEGPWYGDICVPGNTAYLILAEKCLARLAETAGDHQMAARRKRRAEKGEDPRGDHRQLDCADGGRAHRGDGPAHGRGAGLARLDDAAAGAHGGPKRQALSLQRILAGRCVAADQLPDRLGAGCLRA